MFLLPFYQEGGSETQRGEGLVQSHRKWAAGICTILPGLGPGPGLCQPPAIHNRPHLYAALCSIKAHLGFQLVQGSPVLIRVRQGVPIPRGGQEGVTWTMLRAHLDVMASVTT